MTAPNNGNLPILVVKEESIPKAWEESVVKLFTEGLWYKRKDPKDKDLQVDSTMIIEITNPDSDLFLHKYMTCGIEDLLEYEMEMHGAKNSWKKDLDDPNDHRWDYVYSDRIRNYPGIKGPIDQLEFVVDRLSTSYWSRRTNAITWVPELDTKTQDTPCLQSMWFLIVPSEDGSFRLNTNYRFRSRNVMVASPMNMIGLYSLICTIRDQVIERTGMNLQNGRIVDITDSYHVSSRDQLILQNFMKRLFTSEKKGETIRDRCMTREDVFGYMNDIKPDIEEKIIGQTKKYLTGESLEREIEKIKQISAQRERK